MTSSRSADFLHAEQCSSKWSSIDLRRRSESPTGKPIVRDCDPTWVDLPGHAQMLKHFWIGSRLGSVQISKWRPHLHVEKKSPCVDMFFTKYLISSQRSYEISHPMCHMWYRQMLHRSSSCPWQPRHYPAPIAVNVREMQRAPSHRATSQAANGSA